MNLTGTGSLLEICQILLIINLISNIIDVYWMFCGNQLRTLTITITKKNNRSYQLKFFLPPKIRFVATDVNKQNFKLAISKNTFRNFKWLKYFYLKFTFDV